MRTGLQGLTTRGRSFLAAGITAASASLVLGQPALLRIGLLLALLPLACAVVVGRTRLDVRLERSVHPLLVSAGQPAEVRLTLVNQARRSTGLLLLEERLPYALGTRPRFVLAGMRSGESRSVSYQVRSDVRGRFEIGPLTVGIGDPFGLVEIHRQVPGSIALVVTPRTVPLPDIPVGGMWTGTGDNRPRAFTVGSAEDVTVRDYRIGDDLRRVHWRSSARRGELMVRREEQPWQSRATVLLDNRASAHRGVGAASSLEAAVLHAASIATHLAGHGFHVRLVTADGSDPELAWHDRTAPQSTAALLESLAVLQQTRQPHLTTDWLVEQHQGALLIALFGQLDEHDHAALRRMRLHGTRPMALALDVEQWHRGGAGGDAAWLSGLGWSAVTVRPGDPLPALWHELGRRSRQRPGRATGLSGGNR
ncbi:DUF58 domain-containing protein [Nocardioides daejeonensis]|uniref:DUF58 domain-containing protein n=1 Tax=Nocardioides daejeonensis TaxID=1046556 RepID=UPI000D746CB9|nr:DUF58 domain-containing protein [Nocardioides daejeonensis]